MDGPAGASGRFGKEDSRRPPKVCCTREWRAPCRSPCRFDPRMAEYDLGPMHPLKPERVTLAVDLMRAYGLLADDPDPAAPWSPALPSAPP